MAFTLLDFIICWNVKISKKLIQLICQFSTIEYAKIHLCLGEKNHFLSTLVINFENVGEKKWEGVLHSKLRTAKMLKFSVCHIFIRLKCGVFKPHHGRGFLQLFCVKLAASFICFHCYIYVRNSLKYLIYVRFFQFFDQLRRLRMWKMQLLDEHHLFIKYTSEDVVTLRVTDPSQVEKRTQIRGIWASSS